jgi:iron complex outermembrane receptor protein
VGSLAYVTGSFSYIGSRFTQVGDQNLGTLGLPPFGATTPGFPYTGTLFAYDPELPSYTTVNARVGLTKRSWDVALYATNLTDEKALLALDQERGTRARIGYLVNQPRTFGVTLRFNR